jgi:proline iminopeptidase
MTFARLCAHYFSHAAWLDADELLTGVGQLAGIPATLVHGRLDIGSPPDVPWQLARAWPSAELHSVTGSPSPRGTRARGSVTGTEPITARHPQDMRATSCSRVDG